MTNKELQEQLKLYPDDILIMIDAGYGFEELNDVSQESYFEEDEGPENISYCLQLF